MPQLKTGDETYFRQFNANSQLGRALAAVYHDLPPSARCWLLYHKSIGGPSVPPQGVSEDTIYARANDGIWLVDCPVCPGISVHASFDDPHFYCPKCANQAVDHCLIPVQWPRHWASIERELVKRPQRKNRNWDRGETIKFLKEENKQHGIPHA